MTVRRDATPVVRSRRCVRIRSTRRDNIAAMGPANSAGLLQDAILTKLGGEHGLHSRVAGGGLSSPRPPPGARQSTGRVRVAGS